MENTFLPFEFEAFNIARINNVLEYIMFWGFVLKHQFKSVGIDQDAWFSQNKGFECVNKHTNSILSIEAKMSFYPFLTIFLTKCSMSETNQENAFISKLDFYIKLDFWNIELQ